MLRVGRKTRRATRVLCKEDGIKLVGANPGPAQVPLVAIRTCTPFRMLRAIYLRSLTTVSPMSSEIRTRHYATCLVSVKCCHDTHSWDLATDLSCPSR